MGFVRLSTRNQCLEEFFECFHKPDLVCISLLLALSVCFSMYLMCSFVCFTLFAHVCARARTRNPFCTVLYRFVPFCTVLYRLYGAPKVVFQDPGRHRQCFPVFFTCLRAWFRLIFVVFTLVHIADAWSFEPYFLFLWKWLKSWQNPYKWGFFVSALLPPVAPNFAVLAAVSTQNLF